MRNRVCASRQRCFSSSGDLVPTIESLEGRLLMSTTPAIVYSGPITISTGGTYTGNWQSLTYTIPAVRITTSSPVTITNSNIQGTGDLIYSSGNNVNLTVTNTNGYGMNPGVAGQSPGRFVYAYGFSNVVIQNCHTEHVSYSAWIEKYTGSGTITITNNSFLNTDGRISSGSGWRTGNTFNTDWHFSHAIQILNSPSVPGGSIAWNQVINQPGDSRVEDNISMYRSGGTSGSHFLIHDNYVQGAYNIDPTNSTGNNFTYSGGGIILGDGPASDTAANASAFNEGYNNIVVSQCDYGMAIEAGHDNVLHDNVAIFCDKLADGSTIYVAPGSGRNAYQLYNLNGQPGSTFFNNSGNNNTGGFTSNLGRSDVYNPIPIPWTNYTAIPDPLTYAKQAAYWTTWQNKLTANGQTIGPSSTTVPPAPTNLTATPGTNQFMLNWTASPTALAYNVYRSTTSGGKTVLSAGNVITAYLDTSIVSGTTYFYQVTALNGAGESSKSAEVSTSTVVPGTPTNLTATAGNNQVVLAWTASSGASTYTIYRGTTSGGETSLHTNVGTTSYTDATAINGTLYYYKVTAVNSSGESGKSNEVSATPSLSILAAPTNLAATAGNNQVSLNWTGSIGATSYNIYRGATSGSEVSLHTGVSTTSYTDATAINGTLYYYEVTAVNSSGESGKSNEVSATPASTSVPTAPSNLADPAGNGQVTLSWTGSSGATSYNVYRGTTSGQEALLHSGVSGTSYTDSTAANGTTYFYEVTAVNSVGESGKSNEVSATPAVTAVTRVNLGGSFNLDGIVNNGSTFTLTTGVLDGGVAALSANLLGTSQTWNGTPFTIGAAGSSNVVSATKQTISLPAGQDASLEFLALAVNGNQANQTFTVNYADGTTQTFTQSISDWFSPQNYTGESKAVTMAYRDLSNGTKDNRTFYVYGYSFSLEATKTVSSITLPNDANVKLLSVTLSTATSVPTAPSKLAATAGNGQVTLSWTGSSGATSYNVYRGTTSGQECCCIRASAARRIPTARPPTARPTSTRSRPSTPSARAANRTRSPPSPPRHLRR